MEKEVKVMEPREKELESREKGLEPLSFLSTAYLEVLEASCMLFHELEKELVAKGKSVQQRVKQRNNRILQHLRALRGLTEEEPFANEHQAFQTDWSRYDAFRMDAAYFARLALLITDRTFGDEVFMNQIEQFVCTKANKGVVPDELVEKMRIR